METIERLPKWDWPRANCKASDLSTVLTLAKFIFSSSQVFCEFEKESGWLSTYQTWPLSKFALIHKLTTLRCEKVSKLSHDSPDFRQLYCLLARTRTKLFCLRLFYMSPCSEVCNHLCRILPLNRRFGHNCKYHRLDSLSSSPLRGPRLLCSERQLLPRFPLAELTLRVA